MNVEPVERPLEDRDLRLLRVMMPGIANDLQWTQLLADGESDEHGFVGNRGLFFQIVENRVTEMARTHESAGILVTDVIQFGVFDKVCGQDLGDRILSEKRSVLSGETRRGDIPGHKRYKFELEDGCKVKIVDADDAMVKGGDESHFLIKSRSLGQLLATGHRMRESVWNIDVYQLFVDEHKRNPDFDHEAKYGELRESVPAHLLDERGHVHLGLSVGGIMLRACTIR